MAKLLRETGNVFVGGAELEIVRDIKEKCSFVALDYEAAVKAS